MRRALPFWRDLPGASVDAARFWRGFVQFVQGIDEERLGFWTTGEKPLLENLPFSRDDGLERHVLGGGFDDRAGRAPGRRMLAYAIGFGQFRQRRDEERLRLGAGGKKRSCTICPSVEMTALKGICCVGVSTTLPLAFAIASTLPRSWPIIPDAGG